LAGEQMLQNEYEETMTRLFIVEDHPVMRQSLRTFMKRQAYVSVCGEAATAEAALGEIAQVEPDLVLIDVSLPGMSGLDLLKLLREQHPNLPCVMLSGHGERSHVDVALMAGARGYILKENTDELAVALHTIIQGGTYLSVLVQDKMPGAASGE
jgi:DNA-binding NarL/FixJ family response regulator